MAQDAWSSGDAYEAYVGRWSRLVAGPFLDRLDVPPGVRWLDVGCGTGALTAAVLAACAPEAVLGVDASPPFVRHAAAHVTDPRAALVVASAQALPLATASVDVAVAGLVLNFLPDPPGAVAGLRRAVRPGGVVAAYVWDYAGGMQLLRAFWDSAAALDPGARQAHEGMRFAACRPGPLQELLTGAGMDEVAVDAVDVRSTYACFDDCWAPFLAGTGPAPAYVASLDAPARAALREELRGRLPVAPDGSLALTARAWAARGRVP